MRPTHIVFKALKAEGKIGNPEELKDFGLCALCGSKIVSGYKDMIKAKFNDRDILVAPASKYVCEPCAYVLKQNGFRYKMFISSDAQFLEFKRVELSKYLFSPPVAPPFIFCVPLSYHKHLLIKSKINYSTDSYYVQFENNAVEIKPRVHESIFKIIEKMCKIFSKTEISTGDYKQHKIKKYGMAEFIAHEKEIKAYRGTPIFELLLYAV